MKKSMLSALGVVTLCGLATLVGCGPTSSTDSTRPPGAAEKAGAALDRAADKTVETTTNLAAKAVDKTGAAVEKAGAAVEKAGADMQK